MIKWYQDLYLDENILDKVKKCMRKIEKGKPVFDVFCITLASNTSNLFDIINANELLFSYYKKQDIYVLGLAAGKDNAFVLVKEIIEEMYENTGKFDIREYFKFVQQE